MKKGFNTKYIKGSDRGVWLEGHGGNMRAILGIQEELQSTRGMMENGGPCFEVSQLLEEWGWRGPVCTPDHRLGERQRRSSGDRYGANWMEREFFQNIPFPTPAYHPSLYHSSIAYLPAYAGILVLVLESLLLHSVKRQPLGRMMGVHDTISDSFTVMAMIAIRLPVCYDLFLQRNNS